MFWLPKDQLSERILAGTFLNLGSPTAVEIAAQSGFDWLLIDLEHGSGSYAELRPQLLAATTANVAPIVRIRSIDADVVKFVMDSGAAGIMFPYISTVEEAQSAVRAMKYPPRGNRGVAGIIRATDYGVNWSDYFQSSNDASTVVVQIETPEAVQSAFNIASTDGVDILFVGPLDLSVNMGCPGNFTTPEFIKALTQVVQACQQAGKAAGILSRPELIQQHKDLGFRLLALGSDSGAVVTGMQSYAKAIRV